MSVEFVPMTGSLACYADIADEYYDTVRHPTCASLRELSDAFLSPRIAALSGTEDTLVEIGTGKSLLAPAWISRGGDAQNLILVDSSPAMLAYSDGWRAAGARLEVASAFALPFQSGSADIIVASLGDPYNLPMFWKEASRVLRPSGQVLFTTPAHEWAKRFRSPGNQSVAEFVRRDGRLLLMPSPTPTEDEQIEMFADAGLTVHNVKTFSTAQLTTRPATKLLCVDEHAPVLRGYVVRK